MPDELLLRLCATSGKYTRISKVQWDVELKTALQLLGPMKVCANTCIESTEISCMTVRFGLDLREMLPLKKFPLEVAVMRTYVAPCQLNPVLLLTLLSNLIHLWWLHSSFWRRVCMNHSTNYNNYYTTVTVNYFCETPSFELDICAWSLGTILNCPDNLTHMQ